MNNLKNRVQLIGNIGDDPEIKELENGGVMVRFSLATSEVTKDDKGNKIEDTQWHHLVAFGKTAEIVERYCKKGNEIAIEGKLKHNTYEDKEGNSKYFTEIVINEMMMLRNKV